MPQLTGSHGVVTYLENTSLKTKQTYTLYMTKT